MTERPSGWFDDPDDDSQLRYFDGVVWTQHTAAKRPAVPARPPEQFGGPERAGEAWARPGHGYGAAGQPGDGHGTGSIREPGVHGGGRHGALAPWWRRVVAYLLDGFIVGLVATLLFGSRAVAAADAFRAWWSQAWATVEAGGTTPPPVPEGLATDMVVLGLVQLGVFLVYEIGLLAWRGATPGRSLLGLRVVAADGTPARTPALVRRTVVKATSRIFSFVPLLSFAAAVFQLVDFLSPLWDERRQSLHDKAGGTVVVRARPRGEHEPGGGTARQRPGAHRGPR